MAATEGHAPISHEELLRPGSGWAARVFSSPKAILWTGVALLIALGWVYLLLMVVEALPRTDMAETGFGMGVFNVFSDWATFGSFTRELLRAICTPSQDIYASGAWTAADIALVFAMWFAMTLAMMVPTAAPMISTYADIALTAREKDITVVPTTILISGYLSAWLGFCAVATAGQWLMTSSALISPQLTLNSSYVAAAVLAVAGLYQLTPMKHACLTKCRTPLPFFMANWTDRTSGVFTLGFRQGIFCVACCWALMLVMFAVGLMNVIWMAALAVVMALEKTLVNPRPVVQGTGIILIGFAVALVTTTFM